jgi:hypothetical protein
MKRSSLAREREQLDDDGRTVFCDEKPVIRRSARRGDASIQREEMYETIRRIRDAGARWSRQGRGDRGDRGRLGAQVGCDDAGAARRERHDAVGGLDLLRMTVRRADSLWHRAHAGRRHEGEHDQ